MSKEIIIVAGPNGAGKTTFAREFLPAEGFCLRFITAGIYNFENHYRAAVDDWILYDNAGTELTIISSGGRK